VVIYWCANAHSRNKMTKPMDNRIKCSVCQQWREFGEVHDCSIETAQDGAKLFAALPGSVSEGQAWIVEYLCALRPWLRKATWEDVCAKMRDHAPDIYALLSARGCVLRGRPTL
jgi:hypothetical protein